MDEMKKEIALFRYSVIASLLTLEPARGELKRAITRLSRMRHDHPRQGPIDAGFGTIEEWYYLYRKGGLDALVPRSRKDRGHSRKLDDEVIEALEDLARDRPELSGVDLVAELAARFGKERAPSLSTLYRTLRARGLDDRGAPARRDHRAFAFQLAGDLWQGDVMHGPSLCTRDGKRRKTYLIAILDDATRLVCHAEFYQAEDLVSLKDCLKQALLKRGVPARFYFDNGKIFRSRLMLQISARLGIHLIHTRPYKPQGRAKLERWFRTVRMSFLRRVDTNRVEDLAALNRLLFAWIEGEYHVRPHKGIERETPLDRWMRLSGGLRSLPQEVDLERLFMSETTRRVAKDGTLSIAGKRFEAGPALIGSKLTVLYDPRDLRRVLITLADGSVMAVHPVDLDGNRRVRRNADHERMSEPLRGSIPLESLRQLADELDPPHDEDEGEDPGAALEVRS